MRIKYADYKRRYGVDDKDPDKCRESKTEHEATNRRWERFERQMLLEKRMRERHGNVAAPDPDVPIRRIPANQGGDRVTEAKEAEVDLREMGFAEEAKQRTNGRIFDEPEHVDLYGDDKDAA